jgi:hypothetical protein
MNIFQQTEPEVRKKKGYNVVHITRVTGYMSMVSGWNKGKVAELKDRHRNALSNEPSFSAGQDKIRGNP